MTMFLHAELILGLRRDNYESAEQNHRRIPRDPEWCYKTLKMFSEQDFGYDEATWREWFENAENQDIFYENLSRYNEQRKSSGSHN